MLKSASGTRLEVRREVRQFSLSCRKTARSCRNLAILFIGGALVLLGALHRAKSNVIDTESGEWLKDV